MMERRKVDADRQNYKGEGGRSKMTSATNVLSMKLPLTGSSLSAFALKNRERIPFE